MFISRRKFVFGKYQITLNVIILVVRICIQKWKKERKCVLEYYVESVYLKQRIDMSWGS